jgi:hypothetical protein
MSNAKKILLGLLPVCALLCALFVGVHFVTTHAATCTTWYHCPVTQRYGQNQEHGVDLATHGLAITALLPGRVTGIHVEKWEKPYPMVITWQLTHAVCYRGHCADYLYVQIRTSSVKLHEQIKAGQMLGWSYSFIEIGFTTVPAYGHAGYAWVYSGIDPLKIWPHL